MRIAYDVTVSARTATGVGVYARELLAALGARGLDIRRWQRPLAASGPRVNRLANGVRLAGWFGVGAHRRAAREAISVYHSTTSIGPLRRRHPVVITVHDATQVTMPTGRGLADRAFQQVFRVEAARRADVILTPSHAAARAISDAYGIPASRIRVTPLGVAARFRTVSPADVNSARARYGLPVRYVLYVGAQPPRKNLSRLIDAFASLADAHADVHLVLAGPADRRDRSLDTRAADRRIAHRVHAIDVPPDDLPAVYAGAACLAYVSLAEGFGLPIAEAMAAGTPVVTSNCSSMPEVAGGAALCVDPRSVDAIGEGMGRLLGDSALADDLRQRGRARSQVFDWAVTADLTERAYRDVSGT